MGLNDITLGFGGGGSGLLEDILSHYADVSFQWRGGGGGECKLQMKPFIG